MFVAGVPLQLAGVWLLLGLGWDEGLAHELGSEPTRMIQPSRHARLRPALLAGGIAIAVNSALLAGADAVGIKTAHGGLLRLLQDVASGLARPLRMSAWRPTVRLATSGASFQFGFHVFVGLLMAIAYAFVVEPLLPGRPRVQGLVFAGLAWLLNAVVVLPLIGGGLAGSRHLGAAGMIGFAVAHTVYFVLLAVLYARARATRSGSAR